MALLIVLHVSKHHWQNFRTGEQSESDWSTKHHFFWLELKLGEEKKPDAFFAIPLVASSQF